jgi:hypothetical protein
MREVPDRGRIVIVNFEKCGAATPPEMVGTQRPCVVIQNNALLRGALVTLVPLSTTEPQRPGKQHHRMSHLSFRGWPMDWDGQGTPRWAKQPAQLVSSGVPPERCESVFGLRRFLQSAASCSISSDPCSRARAKPVYRLGSHYVRGVCHAIPMRKRAFCELPLLGCKTP